MQTAFAIAPNQMLTTEAAALLGLKATTLSNWREDGSEDLAFSKFGRSVLYRHADVIAYADRRRCTSTLAARRLKPSPLPKRKEAKPPTPQARVSDRGHQPDLLDFNRD